MASTSMSAGGQGVHDVMRNGPANILQGVVSSHPVEATDRVYHRDNERREIASARNVQGLHMPIKLGMEKAVASKIGRLPGSGLPSSNLALRTLLMADGLGPEDIFNDISDNYVPTLHI